MCVCVCVRVYGSGSPGYGRSSHTRERGRGRIMQPETVAAWENTLVHAAHGASPPPRSFLPGETKKSKKKGEGDYRIGKFGGCVRHAGGRFEYVDVGSEDGGEAIGAFVYGLT